MTGEEFCSPFYRVHHLGKLSYHSLVIVPRKQLSIALRHVFALTSLRRRENPPRGERAMQGNEPCHKVLRVPDVFVCTSAFCRDPHQKVPRQFSDSSDNRGRFSDSDPKSSSTNRTVTIIECFENRKGGIIRATSQTPTLNSPTAFQKAPWQTSLI